MKCRTYSGGSRHGLGWPTLVCKTPGAIAHPNFTILAYKRVVCVVRFPRHFKPYLQEIAKMCVPVLICCPMTPPPTALPPGSPPPPDRRYRLGSLAFPRSPYHRRRSSVNFRGAQNFCPKICIKNQQNARILHDSCRKNYQNTQIFMIFGRKIYKIRELYMNFARKMPEFYIIIARKIFFPEF